MDKKTETGRGGSKLVIVESPAKAKKIQNYLGDGYRVAASVGHVRILARSSQVPASDKKKYGKFGVDVEDGFKPYYITDPEKKGTVSSLKSMLKEADELYLATDEDREGEAIAWHLVQVLKPKIPVKRMVFQEITKSAIEKSIKNTRDIDLDMVEAQETRRILDRLYGYELSPLLWRKVASRTSAGRVQSVATRMIVERERERAAFKEREWRDVKAVFCGLQARLSSLGGAPVAQGKDFNCEGEADRSDLKILSKEDALALKALEGSQIEVVEVRQKPFKRSSPAPFTTSTLQQAAGNRLGLSSRTIMRSAQSLYENGFITYMRTDSTDLSQEALKAARSEIGRLFPDSLPARSKKYETRSPGAQEAHEAIRPAGSVFRDPNSLKESLSLVDYKIYRLIYERTLQSQMKDAEGRSFTAVLRANTPLGEALFETGAQQIVDPGFLALEEREKGADLPDLKAGQKFQISSIEEGVHTTQPPARYTEASLVKALETKGIGRPSTYAAIISTILDRGYATERGRALVPSWLGVIVTTIMENYFASLVDYGFTARMEEGLDQIAKGEEEERKWLSDFYFGSDGRKGLEDLARRAEEIDPKVSSRVELGPDLSVRVNHFGAYVEEREGGERKATAPIPPDLSPDELTAQIARDLILKAQMFPRLLGEEGGRKVEVCNGRFGYYVSSRGPEGEAKTASVPEGEDPMTLTLEGAQKLLSLPRLVGGFEDEKGSRSEVFSNIGRYGAYVSLCKKGKAGTARVLKRVHIPDGEVFTIGLERARELLSSSAPLSSMAFKTFPPDPVSGREVLLKNGPFGPYVTDGITNASLPKGEAPGRVDEFAAYRLLERKREGKKKDEG
ncbi:MAG: type I DNA topoisomerase [Aeriscardovia sp.]|nr:type I DNA topoisomerase [Aeriscardovia sp.]